MGDEMDPAGLFCPPGPEMFGIAVRHDPTAATAQGAKGKWDEPAANLLGGHGPRLAARGGVMAASWRHKLTRP